jgi:hypothetical protein
MVEKNKNRITRWIRSESGVSVIFGALLLLSILTVFILVFLVYAIPAYQLEKESVENDTLFLSVLLFSEKLENLQSFSPSSSFKSQSFPSNAAVLVNEKDGCFLFSAPLSLPPESEKSIASNFSLNHDVFSDISKNTEWFFLSSGSVMFYNQYEQLPDQVYFVGPSSFILSQEDGASFIQEPAIFLIRGSNNQIYISLSGFIVRNNNDPVFEKNPTLRYRLIKTIFAHDFVSCVAIRYAAPETTAFQLPSDFYGSREKVYTSWFLKLQETIQSDYPEIDVYFDPDSMSLYLISSVPIEIDVQIMEIEFEY